MFLPFKNQISIFCHIYFCHLQMLLNLYQSKILSFGKELKSFIIVTRWFNLLAELSFVTLTIHLCNGLNDMNLVKTEENVFSYCRIYQCTIELFFFFFSSFFTDQNPTPILNKNQLRSCDEIPRDDGLVSEPTTEVNGNDP